MTTEQLICPWCGDLILETDYGIADYALAENLCRGHIEERHPVRRWLRRNIRQAFRASGQTSS